MDVHLQPVRWTLGKGITFDSLFERLRTVSPAHEEHDFKGKNRRLYVGRQDSYWIAMMLSSRDHKHNCEVEQTADGKLRIDVNRGNPDRPPVDFNFLALHGTTGRGLYLHYYHSTPFDRFSSFCRGWYNSLKQDLIDQHVYDHADDPRAERKAEQAFARTLKADLLVRAEKVADLLQAFKGISRVELGAISLHANEPWSSPDVEAAVKSISHRFSFAREVPILQQRAAASRLISALGARRGRIVGDTSDEVDKVIRLTRNVDSFATYPFDTVAEHMVFDSSDLASAWAVVQIMATIGKSRPYFELE